MADKDTESTPAGGAGEAGHDDHGSFHVTGGGQIFERPERPIHPAIYAAYVLLFVCMIAGYFAWGYTSKPAGVSDSAVADAAKVMASQATYVQMTSPYMIDMYQLPRPGGQDLTQAIAAGSDVYQHYCIGCHGPNQDGAGPNAVSLNPSPRNLRDEPFMQAMSYQRIWTSVHKGVPGTAMPRWENTLNDDQIHDVICYVFSLTAPTDPKTGDFIRPDAAAVPAVPLTGEIPENGSSTPVPASQTQPVPAQQ